MAREPMEILKGTLDMMLLRVLSEGEPMHGWALTRRIDELSDSAFVIEEGSMYPALYRMQKRGWVRSEWRRSESNRRARFYEITVAGRAHLQSGVEYWTRYSEAVGRVMRPATRGTS